MVFAEVTIVTLAEGEISELHVGLKGTMNALFLKDLAQKTRRGLQGRVVQGLSAGGICYGYDLVPGETGTRRINASEASVVQRIFRDYAAGLSPRAIARKLNQKGIPGPSGRSWPISRIPKAGGDGHGTTRRRSGSSTRSLPFASSMTNCGRLSKHVRALFEPATAWLMHGPPVFGSAGVLATC